MILADENIWYVDVTIGESLCIFARNKESGDEEKQRDNIELIECYWD